MCLESKDRSTIDALDALNARRVHLFPRIDLEGGDSVFLRHLVRIDAPANRGTKTVARRAEGVQVNEEQENGMEKNLLESYACASLDFLYLPLFPMGVRSCCLYGPLSAEGEQRERAKTYPRIRVRG